MTFKISTVSSIGNTIYGQEVGLHVQPVNGDDTVSPQNVKRLAVSTQSAAVRGVSEEKFKVRRGWVWEGVPEWAGDTNDWCVRSGGMGTVGPSKVRKSPCKIVVPHSSVANRNSHADPPVSQVYEVGKVTENISQFAEPISLIVAEVSPT